MRQNLPWPIAVFLRVPSLRHSLWVLWESVLWVRGRAGARVQTSCHAWGAVR